MSQPKFAPNDVYALARAVLDCPVFEDASCRMVCQFCGVTAHWQREPFPHALNCVTRIAQDVLTGSECHARGGSDV